MTKLSIRHISRGLCYSRTQLKNNTYTRKDKKIRWRIRTWRHQIVSVNTFKNLGLMSETVDILQSTASRTHVLIFIFWLDTWVITKRQHRHSSSLSAFCCFITSFSREGKPWHLYALANTLWNKQSCEAEPGTNFISGCHLWLITGCSQWLASRSKVLGG